MSPKLTPAIVEDDDDLAEVVDAFVHADAEDRAHLQEIIYSQELLRQGADPDIWESFLQLDERIGARVADLIVVIARWAFEEGRRCPLLPEDL